MNINDLPLIENINEIDIEKDRVIVEKSGKAYQTGIKSFVDRIDTTARNITKTSWVFLGRDDVRDILNEEIEVRPNKEISRLLQVAGFDDIAVPAYCRRILFVFDIDKLDVYTKYRGFYRIASPSFGSRLKSLVVLENVQDAIISKLEEDMGKLELLRQHEQLSSANSLIRDKAREDMKKIQGPLSKASLIPSKSNFKRNMEPANKISFDIKSGASTGYLHSIKILAWSY
jgi:hypothetical protein